MVMEAPPSPQSVGREFVRQYYTLLNKAPTHLHRFYNNQSSFIHGGLDPPNRETAPVIGQKQIHQKIQQLNFRDCHAKITQVDSQSTLGSGVVVQVTGELSNAGHPMRRFTQTFVLAAQSPKKYYVHNDIFRYQDEIISDEECEEPRSDIEDEVIQDRPNLQEVPTQQQQLSQQQPVPPTQQQYYPGTGPALAQLPPQHVGQPQTGIPPAQPPHLIGQPPVPPAVNGHPEDLGAYQNQIPHVSQVPPQNLGGALPNIAPLQPGLNQPSLTPPAPVEDIQPLVEDQAEEPESVYIEPEQELEPESVNESVSNEPKTYANLLKSSPNASVMYNSAPITQPSAPSNQYGRPSSPTGGQGGYRSGAPRPQGPRGPQQTQQQGQGRPSMGQGPPRQDGGRPAPQGRNSFNDDWNSSPAPMRNNDVNQLFLGNLPHAATEDEIRDIFTEYGAIVELRILSKPASKVGPGAGKMPPNYGFITFETQQCLQKCLTDRPIFYPKKDKNGTQLNVEEKRNKPPYQGGGSGGRQGGFDNRNRDGGGAGPRRGPNGPGGPPRNTYNRGGGQAGPRGPPPTGYGRR